MKSTIITIIVSIACSVSSFGQGQISADSLTNSAGKFGISTGGAGAFKGGLSVAGSITNTTSDLLAQTWYTNGTPYTNGAQSFDCGMSFTLTSGSGVGAGGYVLQTNGFDGNVITNPLFVGPITGIATSEQLTWKDTLYSNDVVNLIITNGTVSGLTSWRRPHH